MKSIDDISYPDYSLIDMEYYTRPNPYAIRGIFIRPAYVLASRGCPGMCKFCVAPRLRPYFGTGRFRHEDRIIEEIKHLKDTYHIDGVYFLDDYFTCNPAAVTLLCHKLKPLDLLWGCSSRINVPEILIKTMSESGCIQMDFGVERGSDQSLYDIGKYQTVKQIAKTFGLCKKYKIRTFANMLVNVEHETLQDYDDIESLLERIKPTIVSINVYCKYLGAELGEGKGQLRKIKEFNSVWENLKFHLSWKYIRMLLRSKRKFSYLKQGGVLCREVLNQWFQS